MQFERSINKFFISKCTFCFSKFLISILVFKLLRKDNTFIHLGALITKILILFIRKSEIKYVFVLILIKKKLNQQANK